MKKLKVLAALCALALTANSQPYGQNTYNHPLPSMLSCGKLTSVNVPGFLMGGFVPTTGFSFDNFYIDQTSSGGAFGLGSFSQGYQVKWDINCTPSPTNQEADCFGVDVVECSTNLSPATYYLAVATENGCWFMGLDNAGNTIPGLQRGVLFSAGANHMTKPKIIESQDIPGQYYIAGTYFTPNNLGVMYIFKVDGNGSILWNQTYVAGGNGTRLEPTALIESPYAAAGSPELAVFGIWYSGPGNIDHEGLFTLIDGRNGTGGGVLMAEHYGRPTGPFEDRFFSAAIANANTPGSPGYVIGGFAPTAGSGSAWMMKIKPNGGPAIWNYVYNSSLAVPTDVNGIMERPSTGYTGTYEYYGTAVSAAGMLVMKADQSGNPFSQLSNFNNEFAYTAASSPISYPCSISYKNSTGDEGIHVYGTNDFAPGDFHLVEAYFNGPGGCSSPNENLGTGLSNGPGPTNNAPLNVKLQPGLPTCLAFDINNASLSITPAAVCGGGSTAPGGNNARTGATGISANSATGKGLNVYPNPASSQVQLSCSGNSGEQVTVTLMNTLGQLIAPALTGTCDNSGNYHTVINFETLGVDAGVYFVRFSVNGNSSEQKILYTK